MKAQAIQCSQCGAPLQATDIGKLVTCGSCGSILQIHEGDSGFPIARLVEIKKDTEFLAKRHAAERLTEKLTQLEDQRSKVVRVMSFPFHPIWAGFLLRVGALPALVGLILVLATGDGWMLLLGALAPSAFAYIIARFQHNAKMARLSERYLPVIQTLDPKITETRQQLIRLESELDSLTKAL